MEESFAIYVYGYKKRKAMGLWAATTAAKARRPYAVEFDGEARWKGLADLLMRAATKALSDLEVDGREVTLYVPSHFDDGKTFAIMQQIASGQCLDSAGSGPVWERFLFQTQRHKVTVVGDLPDDKHSLALLFRLSDRVRESR
jgi:hypothetical protein